MTKPYLDPNDQVVEEVSAWCNWTTIFLVTLLPSASSSGSAECEQAVSWGIIVTQAVSLINQIQYNLKPLVLALWAALCESAQEVEDECDASADEKEGLDTKGEVEQPFVTEFDKFDPDSILLSLRVPVDILWSSASAVQRWYAAMRRGQVVRSGDIAHCKAMDEAFSVLDTDGSGALEADELMDLLLHMGDSPMDEIEVASLFAAANVGIGEGIDLPAFRSLTVDKYVTLDGDTVAGIARLCGMSSALLVRANTVYGPPDAAVWRLDSTLPMGMGLRVLIPPAPEDLDDAASLLQASWWSMRNGKFFHRDEGRLKSAFAAIDQDASGSLDIDELRDVLGLLGDEPLDDDDITALVKAGDTSRNGILDLDEFLFIFGGSGFVCLATDTLRQVASTCKCDVESLARANKLQDTPIDDPLPAGLVLRHVASLTYATS